MVSWTNFTFRILLRALPLKSNMSSNLCTRTDAGWRFFMNSLKLSHILWEYSQWYRRWALSSVRGHLWHFVESVILYMCSLMAWKTSLFKSLWNMLLSLVFLHCCLNLVMWFVSNSKLESSFFMFTFKTSTFPIFVRLFTFGVSCQPQMYCNLYVN